MLANLHTNKGESERTQPNIHDLDSLSAPQLLKSMGWFKTQALFFPGDLYSFNHTLQLVDVASGGRRWEEQGGGAGEGRGGRSGHQN